MSYYRHRMLDKTGSLYTGGGGGGHPSRSGGIITMPLPHQRDDYSPPGSLYTPSPPPLPPRQYYSPPPISYDIQRWYAAAQTHRRVYGSNLSGSDMILNVSGGAGVGGGGVGGGGIIGGGGMMCGGSVEDSRKDHHYRSGGGAGRRHLDDRDDYVMSGDDSSSMRLPLDSPIEIKMEPNSPSDMSNMSTDHSPCNSYTAETTTPTIIKSRHKKRKGHGTAGKSIEEELCLICGDRASGYHYNALSCEGCKGFFRRSITKGSVYKCKTGGDCEMDMWMRRRCQSCRLRRCREVGMKEECLLSEEQCKARDVRRKARQPKKEPPPTAKPEDSEGGGKAVVKEEPLPERPLEHLADEFRQLLEKAVTLQDQYELPNEDDVKQITQIQISNLGRPKDLSEEIYKQMAEMTILVTHLVVEFAKRLPGFTEIPKPDQINLLKSSASEVMILRTARRYDIETDTIIFADGTPYTRENMRFGGLGDWVDDMFAFCRSMGMMGVDNAEYALLTAICIFSEREGVHDKPKVEEIQCMYTTTLEAYNRVRRSRRSQHFAKLLVKLADLRTLSSSHKDILSSLKIEKGPLPPLLSEFFDVV